MKEPKSEAANQDTESQIKEILNVTNRIYRMVDLLAFVTYMILGFCAIAFFCRMVIDAFKH